jgi:hypothetical protein
LTPAGHPAGVLFLLMNHQVLPNLDILRASLDAV